MARQVKAGIYEIVNQIDGKLYIGSSVDLHRRLRVHRRDLIAGCHHNAKLQNAWRKHGAGAFVFNVILECDPAVLMAEEQAAFDRLKPDYNLSPTAGNILGFRFTDAQRAAAKGRKQTDEWKRKRADAHRGQKRSEETRARIAEKAKGRPFVRHDDGYRAKLSAASKGKPKSPEHLAALQAGRSKRVYTDEQRAAISAKLKEQYANGSRSKERSPEYREKIAATLRARSRT